MARKSALDDQVARSAVLSAIRRGATIREAAQAIGTTDRSVHRYADRNPAFRIALNEAKAEGERQVAATIGGGLLDAVATMEAVENRAKDPHIGPPTEDARLAGAVLGVDADLVASADAAMPVVVTEDVSVPPMTVHNVLAFCWKTMHDSKAPGGLRSTCTQVVAKVTFEPLTRAQRLRDEAQLRRQLAAESAGDGDLVVPVVDGGSRFTVVLPSNGSEAPGRGPQEPEILEAEVIG